MELTSGQVAVITGAGSGIGKALAQRLVAEGLRVVIADIDEAKTRAVADELGAAGGDVLAVRCDAALPEDVERLARAAFERYGVVDLLCNNAGVAGHGNPWTGPISAWDWVLGINLYGVVHGVRAFLPAMRERGSGHIVNTASMAGLTPLAGAAPYCASKHAVVGLSESLFIELRSEGTPIGVSCLCPGFVRTELMDAAWSDRLGEPPPASTDMIGVRTMNLLRDGVEHGMAPAAVAVAVIDAVRADQFWILTHPETRHAPVARMARASRQENPLLWPDSRHHELVRLRRMVTARVAARRERWRRR